MSSSSATGATAPARPMGGDILSGSAPTTSGAGGGGEAALTDADYSALGDSMFNTMGMATAMAKEQRDRLLAVVQQQKGARSASQRRALDIALAYYHAVHGTSPLAQWKTYQHKFYFEGRAYEPYDHVEVIGQNSLKQFCATYTDHVLRMYAASASFRRALAERAARIGMSPDEGVYVVDFLGKDGSLDHAAMGVKSTARNRALRYRASNTDSVMEQSSGRDANARVDAPPVVPAGLGKNFNSAMY